MKPFKTKVNLYRTARQLLTEKDRLIIVSSTKLSRWGQHSIRFYLSIQRDGKFCFNWQFPRLLYVNVSLFVCRSKMLHSLFELFRLKSPRKWIVRVVNSGAVERIIFFLLGSPNRLWRILSSRRRSSAALVQLPPSSCAQLLVKPI